MAINYHKKKYIFWRAKELDLKTEINHYFWRAKELDLKAEIEQLIETVGPPNVWMFMRRYFEYFFQLHWISYCRLICDAIRYWTGPVYLNYP